MKIWNVGLGVAGLIGVLSSVSAANATPIATAVYTGTVSSAFFPVFGSFPDAKPGDSWIATYIFDLGSGSLQTTGGYQDLQGGTADFNTSPLISATLDIGGVTHTISGGRLDDLYADASGGMSRSIASLNNSTFHFENEVTAVPGAWPGLIQPLNYTLDAGDTSFATLSTYNFSWYINANLTNFSVSVTNPNSVPEPFTLSMFAAGLIGAGAMRIRGRQVRPA